MKRPTDPRYDVLDTYDDKYSEWTRKELQLSRHHEEILTQREALLSYSLSYTQSQDSRILQETAERERARIRNEQFLQNIADAEETLQKEAAVPPSPRLTTLQNNYWSMVRSMLPLYEKSLEEQDQRHQHSNRNRNNSATIQQQTKSNLKGKSSKGSKSKSRKSARF